MIRTGRMLKKIGRVIKEEFGMSMDPNIMGWNDVIENDGEELVILPEGNYTFTVTGFERGQFPGGKKIPPCPKATMTLSIDIDKGVATCRDDLLLYRTLEWKIASFFRCIGLKKHGEAVSIDWTQVTGARGRAHFKPRSYTGQDGTEHQVNNVAYYIDYDPAEMMTPVETEELPWGDGGEIM